MSLLSSSTPPPLRFRSCRYNIQSLRESRDQTLCVLPYACAQGAFDKFRVPGVVVHAGCSDAVGTTHEPAGIAAGNEARGISRAGPPVPMVTVDSLYHKHYQKGSGGGGGGAEAKAATEPR